jgi:serine/threonine-protein kinase
MITTAGDEEFVYLGDFGIARTSTTTALTATGATIGTLEYMAPERFVHGVCDHRSDIYSLGCVLYELLTARTPFPGTGLPALLYAHVHNPPPEPSEHQPSLPTGLDAVVAQAMAKDPDQRYRTTKDFAVAARATLTRSAAATETAPEHFASLNSQPRSEKRLEPDTHDVNVQTRPAASLPLPPSASAPMSRTPRSSSKSLAWGLGLTAVLIAAGLVYVVEQYGSTDGEQPPSSRGSVAASTPANTTQLLAGPHTDITVAIPPGWHQVIDSTNPKIPEMVTPTTCMGDAEEVVPAIVDFQAAVPHLSPAMG